MQTQSKFQQVSFLEIDELILKVIQKYKGPRIAWENRNEVRGLKLPDLKTY